MQADKGEIQKPYCKEWSDNSDYILREPTGNPWFMTASELKISNVTFVKWILIHFTTVLATVDKLLSCSC